MQVRKSQPLRRNELRVLQAMANHADQDCNCCASFDQLARTTRLSKRQVIRIVHALREKGHITFDENRGGKRQTNNYHVLLVANGDTYSNRDISNSDRVTFQVRNSDTSAASFESETGQRTTPEISEPSRDGGRSALPSSAASIKPFVVSLPLIQEGKFYGISKSQIDNWQECYPALDVLQELRQMKAWLEEHRAIRKTSSAMPRFIVNRLKSPSKA